MFFAPVAGEHNHPPPGIRPPWTDRFRLSVGPLPTIPVVWETRFTSTDSRFLIGVLSPGFSIRLFLPLVQLPGTAWLTSPIARVSYCGNLPLPTISTRLPGSGEESPTSPRLDKDKGAPQPAKSQAPQRLLGCHSSPAGGLNRPQGQPLPHLNLTPYAQS
ncbi:hypothetical protein EAI_05494 [Harpegnathos saltator]|uniref:Uncharacterized protein n=1 Tax=Harpegnathos saltator TaxID=610380 RepID=E2BTK0_HARSA|nr:hypothetical protein EAI_05494 [Harpegnathos saltator]